MAQIQAQGVRENAAGDDVVFQSSVPDDSVGFSQRPFFESLGHPKNAVGSTQQQIEQVYLLQNMHKAGLHEATEIARKFNVGIAVRGTGLLAHMNIESGNPTKSVEFKNKTSKPLDLLLCPELEWKDIGSVVHFDPRVGWSSVQGEKDAARYGTPASKHVALVSSPSGTSAPGCHGHAQVLTAPSPQDWTRKRAEIEMRLTALKNMPQAQATADHSKFFIPTTDVHWAKLKSKFEQRLKEYINEDHNYRTGGHYAQHVHLAGIHIRAAQRPNATMVGDHDLFGFTDPGSHEFLAADDEKAINAQAALQKSSGFQAQHGGIWNWKPTEQKNVEIKDVIMGAHGPGKDEPLVYFNPLYKDDSGDRAVSVAFYIKGKSDRVKSVWWFPQDKAWYPS